MPRAFVTLDVFTDRPFGGNPLGLVPDARGLDAAAMQAITREFNYSETIFLFPPDDPGNDLKARIFTPGREIPFAGHPNIGLGVWAALEGSVFGAPVGDTLRVEEGAGLVLLELDRSAGAPAATLTAPSKLETGRRHPPGRIAACASLEPHDIARERHEPTMASVGMGFIVAELATRDALDAARPAPEHFDALDDGDIHEVLYYLRDGDRVNARMFACSHGIPEDPATGSAAAALVAFLAKIDPAAELDLVLDITQGVKMGRPSQITARAIKRGGEVVEAKVSGRAVKMMAGELFI